jgi:hypothetical protein
MHGVEHLSAELRSEPCYSCGFPLHTACRDEHAAATGHQIDHTGSKLGWSKEDHEKANSSPSLPRMDKEIELLFGIVDRRMALLTLCFLVFSSVTWGQSLPAAQAAPSGVWQSANPAALILTFAPNAWEPVHVVDVFDFPKIPDTLEIITASKTKVWAQANSNYCSGGAGFGCTFEGTFSKFRQSVVRIGSEDVLRVSGNLAGTFRDVNGVTHDATARMYFETLPGPLQAVMATGLIVLEVQQ